MHGSPGGWVGGVPPPHYTLLLLSMQHCSDGRKRCKHSAVNVVMRDVYTVLAPMVVHERISMINVTQLQA